MEEKKIDTVQDYIDWKEKEKEAIEKVKALRTIILASDECRADDRITIGGGKEKKKLKEEVYDNLKSIGISTTVVETIERKKKFEEFDIDIQNSIIENPENYIVTYGSESIRIKKVKEK